MTTMTGPGEHAADEHAAPATPIRQSRAGSHRAPGGSSRRLIRARSRLMRALTREWIRTLLALAAGFVVSFCALVLEPDLNYVSSPSAAEGTTSGLLLFALFLSAYRLTDAGIAHLALRELPRSRLLTVLKAARRARLSPRLRWLIGRGTTLSEATQMLVMALIVVFALQARPPGIDILALFALTALALAAAWIGCVIAYAEEYALVDADGEGLRLEGTTAADRLFEDYVHVSVLVQTSNAPADFSPLSRRARRLMRGQSVLAFVLSSVVIALGASALLTVVQPGG